MRDRTRGGAGSLTYLSADREKRSKMRADFGNALQLPSNRILFMSGEETGSGVATPFSTRHRVRRSPTIKIAPRKRWGFAPAYGLAKATCASRREVMVEGHCARMPSERADAESKMAPNSRPIERPAKSIVARGAKWPPLEKNSLFAIREFSARSAVGRIYRESFAIIGRKSTPLGGWAAACRAAKPWIYRQILK